MEDYLEADLRRLLLAGGCRLHRPPGDPGTATAPLKELPWWRRRALLALLPKPDDEGPDPGRERLMIERMAPGRRFFGNLRPEEGEEAARVLGPRPSRRLP